MKAPEAMFDRTKGPNGMFPLENMPMPCHGMMEHGSMVGKDHRMYGQYHLEKGTK